MASELKYTLYRAGALEPPAVFKQLLELYELADSYRPEGRVGRRHGILCSVSLENMRMWATWRHDKWMPGFSGYKLICEGKEPYAYPAAQWGEVQDLVDEEFQVVSEPEELVMEIQRYWNSGIPLFDFLANQEQLYQDPAWGAYGEEILLDPLDILDVVPVDPFEEDFSGIAGT